MTQRTAVSPLAVRRRIPPKTAPSPSPPSIRRGVKAVRARVRGANRFGRGEWSAEATLDVPPIPEPEAVEIDEVPAAWIELDLGGMPELDERLEPSRLLHAKEQLLRALHTHRNVIKVAFTFYALAGTCPRLMRPRPSEWTTSCLLPR